MGRHRCNTTHQKPFAGGMKLCVHDCGFIQFGSDKVVHLPGYLCEWRVCSS